MSSKNLILCLLLAGLVVPSTYAVRPLVHYHDLVAGEGDQGYRDGPFQTAQFDTPQGLAVNPEGTELYVADKGNHCVRVVHLGDKNRVETLAGSGKPGYKDGPFEKALFKEPTALTYVAGNRLAVYDSGNALIRLLDLGSKQVTTLSADKGDDGKKPDLSLNKVWNILYDPDDGYLYFSQPDEGALRRIDLKTGLVHVVLRDDPQVPKPAVLCLYQKHLCVSDWDNAKVFQVDASSNTVVAGVSVLSENGSEGRLLALASWGSNLYGLNDTDKAAWVRLLPAGKLNITSAWGPYLNGLCRYKDDDCVGFVADPTQGRRFFLTSSQTQDVLSLKDYGFDINKEQGLDSRNSVGLNDYEYPDHKPAHTFRILVVGDSLSFAYDYKEETQPYGPSRMVSMPKRLELMLNTEAALDDVPLDYEVLTVGHGYQGEPSFLWPYYVVPDLVKKFDIDLVLYVFATVPAFGYNYYFWRPLTAEGIPSETEDPEFSLLPWTEKMPKGVAGDFYRRCLAKGWVTEMSKSYFEIPNLNTTLKDKDIREDLVEMMGKPIGMLREKLKDLKTSEGKPVQCQMVLIRSRFGPGTLNLYRDFWRSIAEKEGMPFADLVDDFTLTTPTYYPLDEGGDIGHYTPEGCILYAYIMGHELIRRQIIPFPRPPSDHQAP